MRDHSGPIAEVSDAGPLTERLRAIRAAYPDSSPDMVADVVRAVLTAMNGDLTAQGAVLLAEIEALGRMIAAAKQEIAELRVDEITAREIPYATDELDAIVSHTASATHAILESCEMLDEVGSGLVGDAASRLQDATTRIYEECSFQDITGQRITKVVSTLKTIEAKIAQMVATFGSPATECRAVEQRGAELELLNGPQLPSNAMDQSEIDKLLASFD